VKLVPARAIPVLVCIDVEPDPRCIDRENPPPWRGFEASVAFFESARSRLRSATRSPVHFCWFLRMDPQVEGCYGDAAWFAREHAAAIATLARSGDEIGLHAHMHRWDEPIGAWIVDHGDPDWVAHCLDVSFDAFARSLGRRCTSFRFGDGWCSDAALARIEAFGVRYDLTGEPESQPRPSLVPGEAATGSLPGWVGIPRAPYRPSREDFRRPDPRRRGGLWEIPLTAGTGSDRSDSSAPWRTLNLTIEPAIFRAVVERVIEGSPRPYLGFMVRADDSCNDAREVVLANLDFVASHPLVRRFRFSTPARAMRRLGLLSLGERLRGTLGFVRRRS